MKDKKWLVLIGVAAAITFALYWLTSDTKGLLTGDLVNNQEELTILAQHLLGQESADGAALLDKYSSTYEIDVWQEDKVCVEFHGGASGFGSETSYYGFYYSPEDELIALHGHEAEFTADGTGWRWIGDGDNGGYVEKVLDNWYYFEANF